jgi:RNA polymerase sigma-70 factor (ECF subfamily)
MTGSDSLALADVSGPPLATLVARAAAGDERAFARIVDAYHRDLVRVAYAVAGDETTAEDAAQSSWAIAWRKLHKLRDPERVRPWLVSIAANEARQMIRSENRRAVAEIRARPIEGTATDPSAGIDRLDLLRVLRGLDADDRRLLALRYVGGLEPIEIAPLVGMSDSGVRGRLSRLVDRLRSELAHG